RRSSPHHSVQTPAPPASQPTAQPRLRLSCLASFPPSPCVLAGSECLIERRTPGPDGARVACGAGRGQQRSAISGHELVLRPLPLGEPRQRLLEDQGLEVRRLAVLGERRLVLEDLVEEELRRVLERLVDLERETPGSACACGRNFLMMPTSAST